MPMQATTRGPCAQRLLTGYTFEYEKARGQLRMYASLQQQSGVEDRFNAAFRMAASTSAIVDLVHGTVTVSVLFR